MKHLKLFESFDDDIESICDELNITNWKLNPDGGVDVDGNVDINQKGLTKLPLKFGKVTGYFNCHFNKLTTLEGAPSYVGGIFNCTDNKLTTLEGAPKEVGGHFICQKNKLTSLDFAPIRVGGGFYCSDNELITLEGLPREVGGNFDCSDNPIHNVYKLFPDYKSFMDSLDYNYLRGGQIVKRRLEEALDEFGIEMPESITKYKYI
jgi:hypothetical protein